MSHGSTPRLPLSHVRWAFWQCVQARSALRRFFCPSSPAVSGFAFCAGSAFAGGVAAGGGSLFTAAGGGDPADDEDDEDDENEEGDAGGLAAAGPVVLAPAQFMLGAHDIRRRSAAHPNRPLAARRVPACRELASTGSFAEGVLA